jgi:alpha-mannosidase
LEALGEKVQAKENAILVFNDLSWNRTSPVTVPIDEKASKDIVVKDAKGKSIPVQLLQKDGKYEAVFIAGNVPSLGYKTYYTAKGKTPPLPPPAVKQNANYYENAFYKVILGDGGIQSLYDKELDKEILNTTKFKGGDILNAEYTGNGAGEFTQITPLTPGVLSAMSNHRAIWKIVENGAVFSTYENVQDMTQTDVIQRIRIYHHIKKIEFDITLTDFDGTHNRQFRLALPLQIKNPSIQYETPMGIVQVGKDEMPKAPGGWAWGGTYKQLPEEINPREIQNFISANGDGLGVTLSSCVAVADWIDPSREAADYPVLQGILLSSHKSCHGAGNWYEQKGRHRYVFSLFSHAEGWENGYHSGIEANHPLHVVKKTSLGGNLPEEMSFLSVSEPFVQVTTVKRCDTDHGIILRLVDMKGKDNQVRIELPHPVRRVVQTNLIEEEQLPYPVQGSSFILPVGHKAIETFKLEFE